MKFEPYAFESETVAGIPVHVKQVPWARGYVEIRIIVKVGARHDPVGREGLSHFFEHLPFNGCAGHPTLDAIRKMKMSDIFANCLGANTNFERTCFVAKSDSAELGEAMNFLGAFVGAPILDTDEIERERKTIISEIWKGFDRPSLAEVARRISLDLWHSHPVSRCARAFGWEETVRRITQDELINWHRANYHHRNTEVVFVGDITLAQATPVVAAFASYLPATGQRLYQIPEQPTSWPSPRQAGQRLSQCRDLGLTEPPKQTTINCSRVRPAGNETTDLVGDLLTGTLRERLFTEIRGKLGDTYSPQVSDTHYGDLAHLRMFVSVDPNIAEAAEKIMADTMAGIADDTDPNVIELFKRKKVCAVLTRQRWDGTADGIANGAASDLILFNRIVPNEEICERLRTIHHRDVQRLVQEEFSPGQLYWTVIEP